MKLRDVPLEFSRKNQQKDCSYLVEGKYVLIAERSNAGLGHSCHFTCCSTTPAVYHTDLLTCKQNNDNNLLR